MEAADVGDWSKNKRDNDGNEVPRPTPPPELKLAWQCKEWNTLPYGGGVLDQPYGLLSKLQELYGVWQAMKLYRESSGEAEFMTKFESEYEVVKEIRKLRKKHGNSES